MAGASVVHVKEIAVLPMTLEISCCCCVCSGKGRGSELSALVLAVWGLAVGNVGEGDVGIQVCYGADALEGIRVVLPFYRVQIGGMEESTVGGESGVIGEVYHALADHAFPGAVLGDAFGGGASPEEGVGLGGEGAVGLCG